MLTRRSFIKRMMVAVAALPFVKGQIEQSLAAEPEQWPLVEVVRPTAEQERPLLFADPPYDACATTAVLLGVDVAPSQAGLTYWLQETDDLGGSWRDAGPVIRGRYVRAVMEFPED